MRQPRYRELRWGKRNKKGPMRCSVCKQPIDLGHLEAHEECKRYLLGLIPKKEEK